MRTAYWEPEESILTKNGLNLWSCGIGVKQETLQVRITASLAYLASNIWLIVLWLVIKK